jgi:hypothetical protein
MNTRKLVWLRIFCIVLIPLMLTVGCAKRDAQKALTTAQAVKDSASAAKAPGYAPKSFSDANRLFTQAEQKFNSGDYKESIDLYQQAEVSFQNSIKRAEQVKPVVEALIAKIDEAIAKASENLEKARSGDGVPAEELTAAQALIDGINERMETDYRSEVDEEKLNAFLAEVDQSIIKTEALALAHLKPQANQAKTDIQILITRIQELKADVHAPDQYSKVLAQFSELESAERDGQWQKVIDTAAEMNPVLDAVVQSCQEKAAGDILVQTGQMISQAKQLNVQGLDAFTTAVQRAEDTLKTGQTALAGKDYAGAINAADGAKLALKEAYQAVGTQSQQSIATAKTNLENAVAQEAEKYASSVVAQVRQSIASAEELLLAEKFAQAFIASQQALQVSGKAVDAARRGKAQLALNTVEKPFSILHSQGGAKYAPDAYAGVLSNVEKLRGMMKKGEYETVVAQSPEAAKTVTAALDVLSQSTAKIAAKAAAALKSAETAGAKQWVGVQFANASNLKSAADKDLGAKKFLASIRNAESAIKSAQDAEGKAYKLQTEQNIRKVDDFIALAKRAEQDRLSPLAYRKAIQSKEETNNLLDHDQFKNAFQNSKETLAKADRSFNNLVVTAQEKSDSALEAQSMDYSEEEIKQALALLTKAELAQKAQNFTAANELSIESAKLSAKAENFTWQQRSYRLLRDLEGVKEKLDLNLAPEKTPELYGVVLFSLAEARVQQINKDYAASYKFADKADIAQNEIWESMQQELNQTVSEMKQTAAWMGENAMNSQGREIKVKLINGIPALEQAIALKNWRLAYAESEKCQKTAGVMTARLESLNRSVMSKNLQGSLRPFRKSVALAVVPDQKEQINATISSLKKPAEGETYAEILSSYNKVAAEIDNLPKTISEKATLRTEEVVIIMQQAEEAGAKEYYKDWYRDISTDIQLLRNAIRGENIADISKYTRKLDREAPKLLAASQLATLEDEFYKKLENNLNQMNNVFDEFGFLGRIPKTLTLASRLTDYQMDEITINMYKSMQTNMSAKTFRINAELLEDNVKGMNPPKTVSRAHRNAVKSFTLFREAAQAFEMFGDLDAHDIHYREKKLAKGYDKLEEALKINEKVLFDIKEARKMKGMEKFFVGIKQIGDKFGAFYLGLDND